MVKRFRLPVCCLVETILRRDTLFKLFKQSSRRDSQFTGERKAVAAEAIEATRLPARNPRTQFRAAASRRPLGREEVGRAMGRARDGMLFTLFTLLAYLNSTTHVGLRIKHLAP